MSSAADLPPTAAPLPADSAEPPPAWQPFTFPGVAAFAQAPGLQLFLFQVVAAALSAASLIWFLAHCWCPVITQAVEKLPSSAGVTNGALSGFTAVLNSENRFLSIAFAQQEDADLGQIADLQVTLRGGRVTVSSLLSSALGSLQFDYDKTSTLDLSRSHMEPLWGAWQQVTLAGVGIATIILLLILWWLLATLYTPVAKFIAWFCDRRLSWPQAWRLASAALFPGAMIMAAGILFYGWERVDIFGLAFLVVVHFLAGWVYLVAAPIFTPRQSPLPPKPNPFAA